MAKIDHHFQTQLENHKHLLNSLSDAAKFDYERKIRDFGLYTAKKHEAYIELSRLLLIADGHVVGLMGLRRVPDFNKASLEDIKKFIEGHESFQPSIKDKILSNWDSNRRGAIKELEDYLRLIEYKDARKALSEAKKHYWFSQLFLSDAVSGGADELLKLLNRLLVRYETNEKMEERNHSRDDLDKVHQMEDDIQNRVPKLLKLMRDELSRGYYEDTAQVKS